LNILLFILNLLVEVTCILFKHLKVCCHFYQCTNKIKQNLPRKEKSQTNKQNTPRRSNFHNNKKTQTINQTQQNKRLHFQSQTKTTRQTSTTQTMEQKTPKSNAEKTQDKLQQHKP